MTTLRRLGVAFGAALFVVGALPSCTATANVSDVWLSLDEDGARHRSVFYTDTKAIYCIAEVVAGRDNATLELQLRRLQSWDFTKNAFVEVNIVSSYTEQKAAVS